MNVTVGGREGAVAVVCVVLGCVEGKLISVGTSGVRGFSRAVTMAKLGCDAGGSRLLGVTGGLDGDVTFGIG